jgi:hypothetical protein
MAVGRIVHWIGVAFVSLAAILLLVTSVGAPTVHDIGLLKVFLKNASDIRESSVVYGPFGYCVLDVAPRQTDQDYCSHASIGYLPAQEMRLLVPATTWTTWKGHNLDLMTVAYILFPIACFVAFVAAAFAFCGVIGSLIASVLCATAFIITLPVMVVAFVSMGYLKNHVQAAGLKAHYGTGMWTCLAAFILLFFAMLLLFFSCCSGLRGRKNKDRNRYDEKHSKHSKHREDSERSLNNTRSTEHHYGRDAALGGAGVGAYEADRHHHNRETNGFGHNGGLGHDDRTNGNHHYGRDAALGGAGIGAVAAERHHHNKEHNGLNSTRSNEHHLGRDAAVGTAGVGALGAERHHHNNEHNGLGNTRSNEHHLGRDAAIGTAGVGALAAERHHHNNKENHSRDLSGHGLRHAPANDAAARAGEGVHGYGSNTRDARGNNYDSVLANQDRQSLTPDNSHHYGRDAALAGGAAGAGGLAAHEYERSRASPAGGAGVAAPAPREHKLRDTMRDSSNRGYEEPNQRYAGQGQRPNVAPVHHTTTLSENPLTHHHPTTTTSTTTYADERGVHNTGLETRTHDPSVNAGGRGYAM